MKGRARFSIKDEDSACPAVADMLYALCESCSVRAEKGGRFTFAPGPAFEVICAGYETLAVNYPEHVYYEHIS
jgi:hypothetical protein